MISADDEDLFALLGVEEPQSKPKVRAVECGQRPPKLKPVRHTDWSEGKTFEFGGYLAMVNRHHCKMCDALWDELQGIFIEEKHVPSGTRRLTPLAVNGDWPAGGGHRKEVLDVEDRFCGNCIGALGFDREVDRSGAPYTLVQGVGRVK